MKKLISALTSIALLAGVAAMPVAAEETYALGDVTMDGVIDSRDAAELCLHYNRTIIQGAVGTLSDDQIKLADTTNDNKIDLGDCLNVLYYYIYTLLSEDAASPEVFYSDYQSYLEQMRGTTGFDDGTDQAVDEFQDYADNGLVKA